jgi:hypothetical protein
VTRRGGRRRPPLRARPGPSRRSTARGTASSGSAGPTSGRCAVPYRTAGGAASTTGQDMRSPAATTDGEHREQRVVALRIGAGTGAGVHGRVSFTNERKTCFGGSCPNAGPRGDSAQESDERRPIHGTPLRRRHKPARERTRRARRDGRTGA